MGSLQVNALKAIDRLVGGTLYRSLLSSGRVARSSSVRAAPPPAGVIRRILVIRPGGIGDAVLLFPMLQALREAWPDAILDVLAERRNAGIFRANDRVDRVHLYDSAFGTEMMRVLRGSYDLVVDTEQYHYLSAVIAHMTGAPYKCGFDTRGRGGLYSHRVHYDDQTYEVYLFLDLARAVTGREFAFDPEAPFFPVREDLLDAARGRYGIGRGSKTVVMQPGASIMQRRWEPEKFLALARWLVDRGWKTILVGGPSEQQASRIIAEGVPADRVIDLCGKIPLEETAAIVALCDLYVGSDTGVLHIAYGVGTPTVHLFGPGVLEKWAPKGSRYQAISKKLPCSPCIRYNYVPPCPYDTECMKMITVDEVVEAVARITGQ
jgi:lipopolysaccharide heptosyltransferase II